jgi:uncharacterized protein YPO0396
MTEMVQLIAPDEPRHNRSTQWKLKCIQILNWGTFPGYHRLEVSAFGHLVTGESGKGKSTLFDVIPAVMVPPKDHDFNAAARDAATKGRDRDIYSYTRGAYGQQMDENGKIETLYHRDTDKVTWSAVSLTFDHPDKGVVSLVRIFRLPESARNTEGIARAAMIIERDFHLKSELETVVPFRLDVGVLKRTFNPKHVSTDFTSYQERYMRILGLTERSLLLLQKIQAMKGMTSLDQMMRELMLDEPATFEYRDAAVANFADLKAVHESVVTAKAQRDVLAPVPILAVEIEEAGQLKAALQVEREGLERVHVQVRSEILTRELAEAETAYAKASSKLAELTKKIDELDTQEAILQSQIDAGTGGQVTAIGVQISAAEAALSDRQIRRAEFLTVTRTLGWDEPADRAGFDALLASARDEEGGLAQQSRDTKDDRFTAAEEVGRLRKALAEAVTERDSLKRRGASNVPDEQDRIRNDVADALQLQHSELPFAAELMDVTESEKDWQGPIERVLRPLALSMLVPERVYSDVNRYVNANNLRGKIEYVRADVNVTPSHLVAAAGSVISKLDLVESPFQSWLLRRLHRFFDFLCVDTLHGLPLDTMAVTRAGLVRAKNDRHVKDDRSSVDNRLNWILGPDSSAKLAEFTTDADRLEDEHEKARAFRDGLDAAESARSRRAGDLRAVAGFRWETVDTGSAALSIEQLHRSRQLLFDGDPGLQKANYEVASMRRELKKLRAKQVKVSGEEGAAEGKVEALQKQLDDEQARLELFGPVDPDVEQSLLDRLAFTSDGTTRQLEDTVTAVRDQIDREISTQLARADLSERAMLKAFSTFKSGWEEMATEADDTAASLPEYLAILRRIEEDRLPDFEKDFLKMMQEGAHKHLTDLYRAFEEERRNIHRRVEPINSVLDTIEYNTGTTLRIDVNDVPPDSVVTFKRMLQEFTGISVYATPETAEKRYLMLAEIMELLAGDDQRWQREVLDVRRHVEFVAKEMRDGKAVDWFTSSNGRSGGQRVKFVTFTLAAALKYQLTDDLSDLPGFALVPIDEAFAKADAEFTRQSLQVFQAFGFQLMLATPNNKLKTFQPFIGAATVVYRSDETHLSRMNTVVISEQSELDDTAERWG